LPGSWAARGVELLSTGGTAKALQAAGIPVKDIAEHTGFPEMMDGRLKTLHPEGARRTARHPRQCRARRVGRTHGIAPIDLLVVNLYPVRGDRREGAPYEECIENIDIGGPAMIRAAAKNHAAVTVVGRA
jgi:phosphoribosylaminoimidazolecarboxamide formyltransferase/IMP cyclohydrolase